MSIRVEVWGKYACFSRPEMKVERVSYDVMTPSAARGILEAVYWHRGLRWHVDAIYVRNPIKFTNIRRNEVKSTISLSNVRTVMMGGKKDLFLDTHAEIQQRAAMVLQDVRYIIEAHFTLTDRAAPGDNHGKFQDIMKRRLSRGQCYHNPYFGCREFPVSFRQFQGEIPPVDETLQGEKDLGWMLYDMDYTDLENIQPKFFRAVMKDGKIDTRESEVHLV